MAAFCGKGGYVTFNSNPIGGAATTSTTVNTWSLDAQCGTADISGMGTSVAWSTMIATLKSWTASAECAMDSGTSHLGLLGTDATLVLFTGNNTFTGKAIVTGFSGSNKANDAATCTLTFTGSNSDGNGIAETA